VPEVVREPKISYQRVPRLGCFMAVPLIYNSCLFNEALEEAIEDYLVISKEKEEQDRQKAEWMEQMNQKRIQMQESGDTFEEDEMEWKLIEFAPFKTF